jgi:hypothetical protein
MTNMTTQSSIRSGSGAFVVSESSGRVISLLPDGNTDVLFAGPVGEVAGGDRMWLSPEVELFYDDPADLTTWRCPPELDPGSWRMKQNEETVELGQSALGARMTRYIRPLGKFLAAEGLPWSGYQITNRVETRGPMSAWHLVMLPAPADVFVRFTNEPVVYYPPAPSLRDGWIRAEDVPPRWKLGFLPPEDSRCVLGAVSRVDPGGLVILQSTLDPGGTYIDDPPGNTSGTALQVFSSGGDGFLELELHAPLETKEVETTVVGVIGDKSQRMTCLQAVLEGVD